MLKINLLPSELRRKRRKKVVVFEATQTFLILVLVGEVIAFLGLYIIINGKVVSKKKELNGIRAEIERLQNEVRDVKNLEEDAKELEKRIQIIDQLMFSRISWSRKLNEISSLTPENIWLISLGLSKQTVSPPGGGIPLAKDVLILKCKALAMPGEKAINSIGVFMNNLKYNPSFSETISDIEFMGTNVTKAGEKEIVDFELRCLFK